jgi:CheY-like chemotaxis protein
MAERRSSRGGTLLVIDDDPVTADAFVRILTAGGYRVLASSNPAAGFAEIERLMPSALLLLLDLHLPFTDGLSLLRQVRAAPHLAGLKVAIVTGDYVLDDATAEKIRALDARIYYKPIWSRRSCWPTRDRPGVAPAAVV